jgi:hypothetical protein
LLRESLKFGGDYQKYVLDFFPIIVNSACPLHALMLTP